MVKKQVEVYLWQSLDNLSIYQSVLYQEPSIEGIVGVPQRRDTDVTSESALQSDNTEKNIGKGKGV